MTAGTEFKRRDRNGSLDLPLRKSPSPKRSNLSVRDRIFGKWHQRHRDPARRGIHQTMDQGFDSSTASPMPSSLAEVSKELFTAGAATWQGYADTLFTDRAIDFITRHKTSLSCAMSLHRVARVDSARRRTSLLFKAKSPEGSRKPLNATYAAMVYRMDQEIGRILKALDKLELSKNTLVISPPTTARRSRDNQGRAASRFQSPAAWAETHALGRGNAHPGGGPLGENSG